MVIVLILVIATLAFRAAGALGSSAFVLWAASARWALALMFLFTGVAHFTKPKYSMAAMVPKAFPNPMAMLYFTGVCELAGAVGLLLPQTRSLAGWCLIALLIAMFPANVKAAREHLLIAGKPATALWLRLPMQIGFIALAWWVSRT